MTIGVWEKVIFGRMACVRSLRNSRIEAVVMNVMIVYIAAVVLWLYDSMWSLIVRIILIYLLKRLI